MDTQTSERVAGNITALHTTSPIIINNEKKHRIYCRFTKRV